MTATPTERAHEHHPFDAEIEHAGALAEQFAQTGVEDRGASRNRRREDRDQEGDRPDAIHGPAPRRLRLDRSTPDAGPGNRSGMSPPRRKKRIVPWSIGATAAGRPTSLDLIAADHQSGQQEGTRTMASGFRRPSQATMIAA